MDDTKITPHYEQEEEDDYDVNVWWSTVRSAVNASNNEQQGELIHAVLVNDDLPAASLASGAFSRRSSVTTNLHEDKPIPPIIGTNHRGNLVSVNH